MHGGIFQRNLSPTRGCVLCDNKDTKHLTTISRDKLEEYGETVGQELATLTERHRRIQDELATSERFFAHTSCSLKTGEQPR